MSSNISITVTPKLAIIDETVVIKVTGLPACAPITIDSFIYYFDYMYLAFGHFFARHDGTVVPSEQVSYGGSYTGTLSMGMFTSMQPLLSKKLGARLIVKESADTILEFTITVWKGHKTRDELHYFHLQDTIHPTSNKLSEFETSKREAVLPYIHENLLCRTISQRTYLHPSVRRVVIEEDHNGTPIRGILFLPPGPGPFPGLVDLFGGAAGCLEFRAALLAKAGFAALALGYIAYKEIPYKTFYDVPSSYFDSVIDWYLTRPEIRHDGVGMVGVSMGSQMILLCSMRNPKVKASICINGPSTFLSDPEFDINPVNKIFELDLHKISPREGMQQMINGRITTNRSPDFPRPTLTYAHDNPILFLYGENDRHTFLQHIDEIYDQLKKSGKKQIFRKMIKGEGHLLEPPYSPMCLECHTPDQGPNPGLVNSLSLYGGHLVGHEENQMEGWRTILNFFRTHLMGDEKEMIAAKL